MRDEIKVDVIAADYQRNGITGEGFYAVTIRCDGETLLATIAYKDDGETFDDISCRVVNPLDLTSHFRGDRIGDELIPKLKAYLAKEDAREQEPKGNVMADLAQALEDDIHASKACPNCSVPYDADYDDHKDCAQCNRLAPDTMPHGEDETFDCQHCGRHYDDGTLTCTSDDCPGNEEENCKTCGAAPGETHPPGCANLIEEESQEKNITETFYQCYECELDISYDGGDLVSSCFIVRGDYGSSLAYADATGTLEDHNTGEQIPIPDRVLRTIYKWAEDNGY